MKIGFIGLGKMGGNMRTRLREAGHTVVGFDFNPDLTDVPSLEALVEALPSPKVVWVMVPAGEPTRKTVETLAGLLGEGDLVVATHGRGLWIIDDLSPLRSLTRDQLAADCAFLTTRPNVLVIPRQEQRFEGDTGWEIGRAHV